jgi:poly-gamma-glutamate hydrolase-like protein
MATYEATIRRARSSQDDLKKRREHCSADPRRLAAIGRDVGQQVRITRAGRRALYTVSEPRHEVPDTVVRTGPAGRQRLGTSDEFAGVVDSRAPHPTISEERAEDEGEFIERLRDDGRQARLIVIAPHGGEIEPFTDRQAERVRSRLGVRRASAWRCKGFDDDGPAFDSWHITSTDINEVSFPRLRSVISRGFAHAVAFHGFDEDEILVGGTAAPALKEQVRCALERATAPRASACASRGPARSSAATTRATSSTG